MTHRNLGQKWLIIVTILLAGLVVGCTPNETPTPDEEKLPPEQARLDLIKEFGLQAVAPQIEICPKNDKLVRIAMDTARNKFRHAYAPIADISYVHTRPTPAFGTNPKPITLEGFRVNLPCNEGEYRCEDGLYDFGVNPGAKDKPETPDIDERMAYARGALEARGWREPDMESKDPAAYKGRRYYRDSEFVVEPVEKYGLFMHPFNRENNDLPVYDPPRGSKTSPYFESHFDDTMYLNMRIDKVESDKTMVRILCGPSIRTNVPDRKNCKMLMVHPNGLSAGGQVKLDAIETWRWKYNAINPAMEQHGEGGPYDRDCGL